MVKLKYVVPSRIAIDLYDMNGGLGRIDGSMGFSLLDPELIFTAQNSNKIVIHGGNLDTELKKSTYSAFDRLKKDHNLGGIELCIEESIPTHSGFGSKTATLISTAHAYLKLHNKNIDYVLLGTYLKRGGTSGLGINLINKGGFLVDGGHSKKFKKDFNPSSATNEISPAPILAHYKMPEWEVLLCTSKINKTYGQKEINFFKEVCPISNLEVEKLARIRLSQTLPSILEKDLDVFCESINNIQDCGWKRKEIEVYGSVVKDMMVLLKKYGAKGVGMSSIGPTVYAFGENLQETANMIKRESETPVEIKLTKPNNKGIQIKEIL